MKKMLVAQFLDVHTLVACAKRVQHEGFTTHDTLSPHHVRAIDAVMPPFDPALRLTMALCGFGVAILFFLLQTWTSVSAYPFNSGGRPYFSWPIFPLVSFEVGVLAAGIGGFLIYLRRTGLPRLNHPMFDVAGIERATQDRYFLVVEHPGPDALKTLEPLLLTAGALSIAEAAA